MEAINSYASRCLQRFECTSVRSLAGCQYTPVSTAATAIEGLLSDAARHAENCLYNACNTHTGNYDMGFVWTKTRLFIDSIRK